MERFAVEGPPFNCLNGITEDKVYSYEYLRDNEEYLISLWIIFVQSNYFLFGFNIFYFVGSKRLITSKSIIFHKKIYLYTDVSQRKNKEIVQDGVSWNGAALELFDKSLKQDKEIVLAAVKSEGWALKYADESLKSDRDFILEVVKLQGWVLCYAEETLIKDRELVLEAVKSDGAALKYADESLKKRQRNCSGSSNKRWKGIRICQ